MLKGEYTTATPVVQSLADDEAFSARLALAKGEPIRCPVCGGDNCHLMGVAVHQGQHLHVIDGRQAIHHDDAATSGRGSGIVVRYYCEAEHFWSQRQQFHKGTVFNIIVVEPGPVALSRGLWRD